MVRLTGMPARVPASSCTIQKANGTDFCEKNATPMMPFPICFDHAVEIFNVVNQILKAQRSDEEIWEAVKARALAMDLDMISAKKMYNVATMDRRIDPPQDWIYYIAVGETIKIGYSSSLDQRIKQYPPYALLLAVEQGDRDVERERHYRFRLHRMAGREWFHPHPDLVAHIKSIRHVEPPRRVVLADLRDASYLGFG